MKTVIDSFFEAGKYVYVSCEPIKQGLINRTFLLVIEQEARKRYVLQQINTKIFANPAAIMQNIVLVAEHLEKKGYPKTILRPLPNLAGQWLSVDADGQYWRLFPFIEGTVSYDSAPSVAHVAAAASALSEYHHYLSDFDVSKLEVSIPDFLNINMRYKAFVDASKRSDKISFKVGNPTFEAENAALYLVKNIKFCVEYIHKSANGEYGTTVIHGDPKISNFLFDPETGSVKCIIDLDTLMPGPWLYDFGDMARSFVNNQAEDSQLQRGVVNKAFLFALMEGYAEATTTKLTTKVLRADMRYAAQVIVFIQALRFMTDYLEGNVYFKVEYPEQNLHRALNQIRLFKALR